MYCILTMPCVGMVGIGGLYVMGGGLYPETIPQMLGAASVLLASVNVFGGFVITKRMLDMFKRMCTVNITSLLALKKLLQVPRTHQSTATCTVSLLSFSLEASWLLRALAWPVSCKLGISRVACCALVGVSSLLSCIAR